jgi:adenosylmethionine-8-amino-7-oxononanoate aminotransferase
MRDVCHRHGALFVLDEVSRTVYSDSNAHEQIMCGFGRTGKLHAWEWEDCHPDVQILGKGVNGGYSPLSAVLADQKVVDVFQAGSGAFANGYTYQSSAIGCRAALECYKYIKKHNL